MGTYFLDTSAIIKRYILEQGQTTIHNSRMQYSRNAEAKVRRNPPGQILTAKPKSEIL